MQWQGKYLYVGTLIQVYYHQVWTKPRLCGMSLPLRAQVLQHTFLLALNPRLFVQWILLLMSAEPLGDRSNSHPAKGSEGACLTPLMPSSPSPWPQSLQGRGQDQGGGRVFNNNTVKGSVLAFLTWAHRWGQCGISYAPAAVRGSSWTCGTRHTQTSGWWGVSADGAQTCSSSCRQSCKKRIRTLEGPKLGVQVRGVEGQEGKSRAEVPFLHPSPQFPDTVSCISVLKEVTALESMSHSPSFHPILGAKQARGMFRDPISTSNITPDKASCLQNGEG